MMMRIDMDQVLMFGNSLYNHDHPILHRLWGGQRCRGECSEWTRGAWWGAACKCCMLTFPVPYNHLDPYNGCSKCCTIPVSGLIPVNTALLQYGPKLYADHALYGCNCIRYSQHPYFALYCSLDQVVLSVALMLYCNSKTHGITDCISKMSNLLT